MSTVAEIAGAISQLSNDELPEVEKLVLQSYRERKIGIIFDDAYGIFTEEDLRAMQEQVLRVIDGNAMNLPQRGEVWLADCGMKAKVRPVVVISIPYKDTDRALFTVVPHTTRISGSEFEVHFPIRWLENGAFNIQATFAVVPPQFIRKLGDLMPEQLAELENGLRRWEGLR